MIRRIIEIDEQKCNGCGACAMACQEGAIAMVNGKAKLMREDYCDGLGNCLPACPVDAIHFVEREAPAFDEAAVLRAQQEQALSQGGTQAFAAGGSQAAAAGITQATPIAHGCPGSMARAFRRSLQEEQESVQGTADMQNIVPQSMLQQWPVQIQLVPIRAPYFDGANLLIAADCSAFAYGNFHQEFIRNHITLIGCPKLDPVDYSEKLRAIIEQNDIRSLTIVRMEVPCCGGIEYAAKVALQQSGKFIPWQVVTISTDGRKLEG